MLKKSSKLLGAAAVAALLAAPAMAWEDGDDNPVSVVVIDQVQLGDVWSGMDVKAPGITHDIVSTSTAVGNAAAGLVMSVPKAPMSICICRRVGTWDRSLSVRSERVSGFGSMTVWDLDQVSIRPDLDRRIVQWTRTRINRQPSHRLSMGIRCPKSVTG